MANPKHLGRLRQGVEVWNQWRKENPRIKPDLSGADLSGANLNGANFSNANLSGVDFTNARVKDTLFVNVRGLTEKQKRDLATQGAMFYASAGFPTFSFLSRLRQGVIDSLGLFTFSFLSILFGAGAKCSTSFQALFRLRILITLSGADHCSSTFPKLPDEVFEYIDYHPLTTLELLDKAFCYVHAEMDDQVIVRRVTTVEVVVSKEQLERITSAASQEGKAEIDLDKRLIIQVIPKTNFTVVEADRVEIDLPGEGKPHSLYFDLRATHLGEGEVWVLLRQAQLSLLTLVLKPQIVENRAAIRAMATAQFIASPPVSSQSSSQRLRVAGIVAELPPHSEPLHQLRIIERRNGTQITYLYELNSPLLGVLSLHESRPITSDCYDYVENLYKEIESRWLNTQGDVEDFEAELRAFGGQLFGQLFPEPLQQQLWSYRDQLDNIMVISTEPFIPWELVHLKPPGQNHLPNEIRFLGQMGLVRWLHDVGFPSEEISIRPGDYARYVIPHYPDSRYRLPQAEQESQFLEQRFGATEVEAQPNYVRSLLETGNFDLLHFAGHGMADQGSVANAKLLLEGRVENGKYVPAYLSATTVEQYCNFNGRDRNNRPMVVLNACQIGREGYTLTGIGGFAQAFLKGGVGVFVGTLWSVGDRPARIFTETLYSSLIEGMTLAEATIEARQQAKQAGDATWLAYVVYGHPHLKLRVVNDFSQNIEAEPQPQQSESIDSEQP